MSADEALACEGCGRPVPHTRNAQGNRVLQWPEDCTCDGEVEARPAHEVAAELGAEAARLREALAAVPSRILRGAYDDAVQKRARELEVEEMDRELADHDCAEARAALGALLTSTENLLSESDAAIIRNDLDRARRALHKNGGVPLSGSPHVCGRECGPGWRLRDIIEYGAVYGAPATEAVIAWDAAHKRDPAAPRYDPQKEGVTYGV